MKTNETDDLFGVHFKPMFEKELNFNKKIKVRQGSFSTFRMQQKQENVIFDEKYIDMTTTPVKKKKMIINIGTGSNHDYS